MALQVWLPLNGNLNNQGLADVTVTNNGATVNTSGKIGSCYSFDGSDDFISLESTALYQIIQGQAKPFSFAFWVYHADSSRAILFGDYGLSGGINFNIELSADHAVRFYWNGSPDKYVSGVVATSGWTHVAIVYDCTDLKYYKDGVLSDTYTVTLTQKNKTSGVYYLGRDSRTGPTALNGRLNDFRLYDHALSPLEVAEIAKGLVLHYPLNDSYIEPTTNLCTTQAGGWNNSGTCVRNTDDTSIPAKPTPEAVYSLTATSDGSMAISLGNTTANLPSKTLVASVYCWLDGTQDSQVVYLRSQSTDGSVGNLMYNGNSNPLTWPKKRWIRLVSSPITTASNATTFYICTYVNKNTEVRAFNGWQIEENTHVTDWVAPGTTRAASTTVYDTSGFGNNGTVNNDPTSSFDTPRYLSSICLDGVNQTVQMPNLSTLITDGIFTANIWFKKVTDGWGTKNYETIFGGPSGFELETKNSGTNSPVIRAYNWGGSTFSYTLDVWHMLTMVRTTEDTKFYLDGELELTGTAATIPSGNYFLGSWRDTTSQNYKGQLSDFRLYATALTADQVKQLYEAPISLANNGTLFANEFNET